MYVRRFLLSAVVSVGILAASQSSAFAQVRPLFAVLVGGNEVTAAGLANQGDLDGFGTATFIVQPTPSTTTETVCFGITVRGILNPTAAHIHQGRAGVNGPVVVTLLPVPGAGNPGTSSGCAPNVPNAVISGLLVNPSNFYVNVHNGAFPNGALRGQLF